MMPPTAARADAYCAIAFLAWLAGAYWIGAGLRAQAAATDRLAQLTYCTRGFTSWFTEEDAIECSLLAARLRDLAE